MVDSVDPNEIKNKPRNSCRRIDRHYHARGCNMNSDLKAVMHAGHLY